MYQRSIYWKGRLTAYSDQPGNSLRSETIPTAYAVLNVNNEMSNVLISTLHIRAALNAPFTLESVTCIHVEISTINFLAIGKYVVQIVSHESHFPRMGIWQLSKVLVRSVDKVIITYRTAGNFGEH